jgi:hypothetical protein
MVACSGPTAAVFTSPPRCGRCCRRPVRRRSLLPWWPRHWPASRMTSVMLGSRGGLTPVLPARRWPSGQVTARECPTGSTRTASTGTTSGGTSGWRTSLASLESGSGFRVPALSRADLDRCRRAHSAYIPGLATSGGLRRHMAARPFSRGQIISAAQAGFSLIRLDAPSGIRTCAHGSGRALILTPVTCEDQQKAYGPGVHVGYQGLLRAASSSRTTD